VGCHPKKTNSLGNALSKQEKVPFVGNNEKKTETKVLLM
jgi:hypothetical protein